MLGSPIFSKQCRALLLLSIVCSLGKKEQEKFDITLHKTHHCHSKYTGLLSIFGSEKGRQAASALSLFCYSAMSE